MAFKKVGVVGLGQMGSGIAQVAALAGLGVVVREADSDLLERGMKRIRANLDRAMERGRLKAEEAEAAWGRLSPTQEFSSFAECDLIHEAITEDLGRKQELLRALDETCKPATILASNTSSIPILELAVATGRPDRVVGLHFFNPADRMALVEVIRSLLTSEETFSSALDYARKLGKEPVVCKDRNGFIANRLLVPYLLDAIRAYEEGLASMEDIDKAMRLGCGHPMGPFALMDLIGLDVQLDVANSMYEEYREPRFAPPPLLRRLVAAGFLGRKTGRGFYEYPSK